MTSENSEETGAGVGDAESPTSEAKDAAAGRQAGAGNTDANGAEPDIALSNKDALIRKLRTRADSLKRTAYFILVLIMGLLGGGGYVIYEADRFITADLSGLSPEKLTDALAEIDPSIGKLKTELARLNEAVAGIRDQKNGSAGFIGPEPTPSNAPPQDPEQELTQYRIEKTRLEIQQANVARDLEQANQRLLSHRAELTQIEDRIATMMDQRRAADEDLDVVRSLRGRLELERDDPEITKERYNKLTRDIDDLMREQDRRIATLDELRAEIAVAEKRKSDINVDINAVDVDIERLKQESDITKLKLSEIEELSISLAERLRIKKEEEAARREAERLVMASRQEAAARATTVSLSAGESVNSIESLVQEIRQIENQYKAKIDESVTSKTISTLTARITVVFILIFLTQILVNLYRYNMRLAFFYDGRADALELYHTGSQSLLEGLVDALSPERMDFGKTPQSPARHAIELAKTMMDNEKKVTGKVGGG